MTSRIQVLMDDLMIPVGALTTFGLSKISLEEVLTAENRRFDEIPVVDDGGNFVGILTIERAKDIAISSGRIKISDLQTEPLSVSEAPDIFDLLEKMSAQHSVLVHRQSEGQGPKWTGMVTISDLNKQQFRAYIYPILATLEVELSSLVDSHFADPIEWIRKCSETQQVQHLGQWELAKSKGVDSSPVISCTLTDLITVIAKTPELLNALGYTSKSQFQNRFNSLVNLRNQIMHPVRPLVLAKEEVRDTLEKLRYAVELTQRTQEYLNPDLQPV